jgi:hypothetical protein
MKRNRELCPVFGDVDWEDRFTEFLNTAYTYFTHCVKHQELWHHASLNIYDVD